MAFIEQTKAEFKQKLIKDQRILIFIPNKYIYLKMIFEDGYIISSRDILG